MSITTTMLTNFSAGELSPRLSGRVDLSKYFNGCRTLENFQVHAHGGASRRSGFRYIGDAVNHDKPSLLIPFEFNSEETYVLELGEDAGGQGKLRVYTRSGRGVDDADLPYEKNMPYKASEFDRLRYVQSNATLIIVHPDHPPRKLVRKDHADWELSDIVFISPPEKWKAGNYPSCVCFFQERLVLAATNNEPDTIWFSRTGETGDFRLKTREVPLNGWRDTEIIDANNDGKRDGKATDTFEVLDGATFEKDSALKGQSPAGEIRYFQYKGAKSLTAKGSTLVVTFADSPGSNQIESIHDGAGNVRTDFWASLEVGDRVDAPAGEEPLDSDAIEVTIAGRGGGNIEFMVPKSLLWVGTSGGEWTLGSKTGPTTPANIKANQEGNCSAAPVRPENLGYATAYVQRSGKKLREMSYRFDTDSYASTDLTLLSEHITGSGVCGLSMVAEPDPILYCLRNDGVLVAMTFERDQQVFAWSRLITKGAVESICSIYDSEGQRDQLWAVVRRTIKGQTRRFVELLEATFTGELKDAFFVDCGLTHDGVPTSEVSGLEHLAGEKVAVLADGAVQAERVVSDLGTVTLDRAASVVHVGLPYVSRLQPMRLEVSGFRRTSQTKSKRIVRVAVRFRETLGGRIGPDEEHLETIYFRTAAAPMGSPPELWSGDKKVQFPQGWNVDSLLTIIQDMPLPMTVQLIVPDVVVN